MAPRSSLQRVEYSQAVLSWIDVPKACWGIGEWGQVLRWCWLSVEGQRRRDGKMNFLVKQKACNHVKNKACNCVQWTSHAPCAPSELNLNNLNSKSSHWFFETKLISPTIHMANSKLVPKHSSTRIHGQHRCNHCGKDLPTAAGLSCHIGNSKTSGCPNIWEQEVLWREPTKSPSPPATGNDVVSPKYDLPVLDFPLEELLAFILPERLRHPASPVLGAYMLNAYIQVNPN